MGATPETILSGAGTPFWGDTFKWPNTGEVAFWRMVWDRPGNVPDFIADIRVRVEYLDEEGDWQHLGDQFRTDITPQDVMALAGGREYRLHLRHVGNSLPRSSVRVDYRMETPEGLRPEFPPPHEPKKRPRASSAKTPAPVATAAPEGESLAAALMGGPLSERTILLLALQQVQNQREDNAQLQRASLELAKIGYQSQAASSRASADPEALALLKSELAEERARNRRLEDEVARLREESHRASLRLAVSDAGFRASQGQASPVWQIVEGVLKSAAPEFARGLSQRVPVEELARLAAASSGGAPS